MHVSVDIRGQRKGDFMTEEQRLFTICTMYEDNRTQRLLNEIQFENIQENHLLTMLRGDYRKIRGLVRYNIVKHGLLEKFPENVQQCLMEDADDGERKFFQRKRVFLKLAKSMEEKGYSFVLLKGFGIAETIYRNKPEIRNLSDIDILVHPEAADDIYQYLKDEHGFQTNGTRSEEKIYKEFFQHYAPLERENVCVEMHHRLTQKMDPYSINARRIMEDAFSIMIDDVYVKIPCPTDMLIAMSYHLYQHEYREARYMLKPYSDLFNFLNQYKANLDWHKFISDVKSDGIEFPMFYALFSVNELYEKILEVNVVPCEILQKLFRPSYLERKEEIVSRHLLNQDVSIGRWKSTHMDRLYMDIKDLRKELCKQFFFYFCDEKWKKECETLRLDFDEGFEFLPRAWEKYRRI